MGAKWLHSLRLSDAFAYADVWVYPAGAKPQIRSIPIGMPRIKRQHEECVFFLLRDPTEPPEGTGFFALRRSPENAQYVHCYAVSNHHVTQAAGACIIRVNTKSGGTRLIPTEPHDWCFSGEDDLSAYDVTDLIDDSDQISCVEERDFLSQSFMRKAELAIGDEAFMVGLFAQRNGGS